MTPENVSLALVAFAGLALGVAVAALGVSAMALGMLRRELRGRRRQPQPTRRRPSEPAASKPHRPAHYRTGRHSGGEDPTVSMDRVSEATHAT